MYGSSRIRTCDLPLRRRLLYPAELSILDGTILDAFLFNFKNNSLKLRIVDTMNEKKSSTVIRLGVIGALGRMGQMIVKLVKQDPTLSLHAMITKEGSRDVASIVLTKEIPLIIKDIDLLIDFSSPEAICDYVPLIQTHPVALVIGTTGLQAKHYTLLRETAHNHPILYAANFSFGIFLLTKILQTIISYKPKCKIEITETHHKMKKDQPSGTAKALCNQLQPLQDSISIQSFRKASTIGTHRVILHLQDEDISISHSSNNRSIFAEGAIQAGKWLMTKPPGIYTIEDYFSCQTKKSFISV